MGFEFSRFNGYLRFSSFFLGGGGMTMPNLEMSQKRENKDCRHEEKSIAIIRTNQCRQTAMATNAKEAMEAKKCHSESYESIGSQRNI